ncbi:MAG: SRPBCC domain-containing protein [Spirochaetales bacterium]|nr:SRPBCC domain-containing protein [Spirochaetales bacterium]
MNNDKVNITLKVEITRIFDAPIERVWELWSESEKIKKWWGPKMFSCPVADVDLREGGTTLVCMRGPLFGWPTIYSTWAYTKIVPHERIEYTFNFSDDKGNKKPPIEAGIPEDGHHVVIFKDLGDDKTEIHMVEYGYTKKKARNRSQSGLEQCFNKMAQVLNYN